MNGSLSSTIGIISSVAAGFVFLALWLVKKDEFVYKSKKIDMLSSADKATSELSFEELQTDSLERKLAASNIKMTPATFAGVRVALGVGVAFLSTVAFLPGIPAYVFGLIAWRAPLVYINEKARNVNIEIDELLPLALMQISAGVQSRTPLKEILTRVGNGLVYQEGKNPLSDELLACANQMGNTKTKKIFTDLSNRTPSKSLQSIAILLSSQDEKGGSKYAEAISMTANGIQEILTTRNTALAEATSAKQAAQFIPAMLVFFTISMQGDPFLYQAMRSVAGQIVIAVIIVIMYFANLVIKRIVSGAVS